MKDTSRASDTPQIIFKGCTGFSNFALVESILGFGGSDESFDERDIVICLNASSSSTDFESKADTKRCSAELTERMLPGDCGNAEMALYFIAQQGDELLTFAMGILRDSAKRVGVVLVTNGVRKNAIRRLDDGKSCARIGDAHDQALTSIQFRRAFDKEFISSCRALRVGRKGIRLLGKRIHKGKLSTMVAKDIISSYLAYYPFARICTFAPLDQAEPVSFLGRPSRFRFGELVKRKDAYYWKPQDTDRLALGSAATDLAGSGCFNRFEFFVEYSHFHQYLVFHPDCAVDVHFLEDGEESLLLNARHAYITWDPPTNHYAIGWHTLSSQLDDTLRLRRDYTVCQEVSTTSSEARDKTCVSPDCIDAAIDESVDMRISNEKLTVKLQNALQAQRDLQQSYDNLQRTSIAIRQSTSYTAGKALLALPRAIKHRLRKRG